MFIRGAYFQDRMANGKPDLFEFLSRYYTPARQLEMKPMMILDTSAIIDMERAFQKQYGLRKSYRFLEQLERTAPGVECIIPPKIKKEIETHALTSTINGRPEIATNTYELLQYLPEEYAPLKAFVAEQHQRLDKARYFLRQMHYANIEGKKCTRDPISQSDWEVIDMGISLGVFAEETFRRNTTKGIINPFHSCPKISVLSSDYHIIWTIERAFQEPEGVEVGNYLKAVDVRRYALESEVK